MADILFWRESGGNVSATVRAKSSWQHIYTETHYSVTARQARRIKKLLDEGHIPDSRARAWIAPDPAACGHCQNDATRVL